MKPGARLINAARGDVVDQDALVEALTSGHLGGAGIDVFPQEPTTESPLFGLPGVVVTPHLGASTEEAQDRAGVVVAEQVAAALTGGVVTSAVNIPSVGPEALAVLGPFLPLARQLGQLHRGAHRRRPSPLEITYEGELANLDTRLLTSAVLAGVLNGHVEEAVNIVNARVARRRARHRVDRDHDAAGSRDYTNRLSPARRRRQPRRHHRRHHLAAAPGGGLRPGHRHRAAPSTSAIFRNLDVPGQIGRVGTILGKANVNIASMAVSRSRSEGGAVMAVTVDSPVPPAAAEEIAAGRRLRARLVRHARPGVGPRAAPPPASGPGTPASRPWPTSTRPRSIAGSAAGVPTGAAIANGRRPLQRPGDRVAREVGQEDARGRGDRGSGRWVLAPASASRSDSTRPCSKSGFSSQAPDRAPAACPLQRVRRRQPSSRIRAAAEVVARQRRITRCRCVPSTAYETNLKRPGGASEQHQDVARAPGEAARAPPRGSPAPRSP